VTSHHGKKVNIKDTKITSAGKDMEKWEHMHTVGGM
jgi:hypothetical protein